MPLCRSRLAVCRAQHQLAMCNRPQAKQVPPIESPVPGVPCHELRKRDRIETARMHCWARRAGYPSVSSRAARQQPRTRLAGGGPPHYSTPSTDSVTSATASGRPAAGRCRPCAGLVPARARNHCHRTRPQLRARARCIAVTVTGPPRRPGGGASPGSTNPGWGTRLRHRAGRPAGRTGAARAAARAGPRGPLSHRTSRLAGRHSGLRGSGSPDWIATAGARASRAGTAAVGQGRGRVALK